MVFLTFLWRLVFLFDIFHFEFTHRRSVPSFFAGKRTKINLPLKVPWHMWRPNMGDVRSGLWASGALEFWFQCNAVYALYLVICTFYPVTDVYSCSWGALLCGVPRLNKWTESHWWSYQTDRCLYNQLSCHLKRESCTTPWQKREGWSLESKYFVTECSGESRGGARFSPPLLFLD